MWNHASGIDIIKWPTRFEELFKHSGHAKYTRYLTTPRFSGNADYVGQESQVVFPEK